VTDRNPLTSKWLFVSKRNTKSNISALTETKPTVITKFQSNTIRLKARPVWWNLGTVDSGITLQDFTEKLFVTARV